MIYNDEVLVICSESMWDNLRTHKHDDGDEL
jgi:hypothetical protein